MKMCELPIGTLLRCISTDYADEPHEFVTEVNDIVVVLDQNNTSYAETHLLSLIQGVTFVSSYGFDCVYNCMDSYELYEL